MIDTSCYDTERAISLQNEKAREVCSEPKVIRYSYGRGINIETL